MRNEDTARRCKSPRMRSASTLAAGWLAVALALSPAALAAGENDGDSKTAQAEQRERDTAKASTERGDKPTTDLESCKRDAEGMKGPDRSRFMTACLRERK